MIARACLKAFLKWLWHDESPKFAWLLAPANLIYGIVVFLVGLKSPIPDNAFLIAASGVPMTVGLIFLGMALDSPETQISFITGRPFIEMLKKEGD